jgi:signal transduction histidine kinase
VGETASETPPRVLVIDDNHQNRALFQATLEDEGYDVALAAGGQEGVRKFESERPDCVLLDVRMPDLDGFAVCARIRGLPGGAETPVVFLTAQRDVDTFDRAQRAGADDFLTKPVSPAELTARVRTALRVRRMSAELREQYDLVRRQRDDLLRLQLSKERLTSFVIHDLKNPVNSLDLLAQVLLRDRALPPRTHEIAQLMRGEARSLLRLILNLLDISRSEEGQLAVRREPIDVAALAAEILSEFGPRAREAGIALRSEIEAPSASGDVDLVRRVLENLVDNALKHGGADTTVTVASRRAGAGVELRVADQGRGIPPGLRDAVFHRYVQAREGAAPASSRGLGLAFCKLAVEALGGRIWIESGDPGAVFCLSLPDEP